MQNQESIMFKTGDLVIGSSDPSKSVYSATGAKVMGDSSFIYGSPDAIRSQQEQLTNILRIGGGQPLAPSGTAKSKKKKKTTAMSSWKSSQTEAQEQPHVPRPEWIPAREPVEQTIQFENDFGKMKAKVTSCVEHDMAFMLTFKDEDSVLFEPKIGEQLFFYTPDKYRYSVYYPGVTFDSPDSSERIMILFKVPEENQE